MSQSKYTHGTLFTFDLKTILMHIVRSNMAHVSTIEKLTEFESKERRRVFFLEQHWGVLRILRLFAAFPVRRTKDNGLERISVGLFVAILAFWWLVLWGIVVAGTYLIYQWNDNPELTFVDLVSKSSETTYNSVTDRITSFASAVSFIISQQVVMWANFSLVKDLPGSLSVLDPILKDIDGNPLHKILIAKCNKWLYW